MTNIIERLGLSKEVKEITLGRSFDDGGNTYFHTFRYDFKPASVDVKKSATVDIGERHQVTVAVPHVDKGSGTTHAVFKGSKKPYAKECVLIIDHITGNITLEKLTYNVQLKKTRAEGSSKIKQCVLENNLASASSSKKMSPAQKSSPREKSSNYKMSSWPHHNIPLKCSPLPKSPNSQSSPPNRASPPVPSTVPQTAYVESKHSIIVPPERTPNGSAALDIGVMSSSDSSSEDSSSSSDSESSENEMEEDLPSAPIAVGNSSSSNAGSTFAKPAKPASPPSVLPSMPKFTQLSQDLQLSESDSDD